MSTTYQCPYKISRIFFNFPTSLISIEVLVRQTAGLIHFLRNREPLVTDTHIHSNLHLGRSDWKESRISFSRVAIEEGSIQRVVGDLNDK
jgi:hypothetical protein